MSLRVLLVLVLVAAGSVFGAILLGPAKIRPGDLFSALFHPDEAPRAQRLILWEMRFPRAALAFTVGAALSLSGGVMQGIFHNPLASPYVLGVAGGAAAGAAAVIALGIRETVPVPLGAFLGALGAVALVYQLGKRARAGTALILAGVAVGSLLSAVTSFIIFVSAGDKRLVEIVFWTMGSFVRADWPRVWLLGAVVGPSLVILWGLARRINALALGDEGAQYVGVDPVRLRRFLLLITTSLTAASVSVCGTVGFVGLVAPHLVRLVLGPDHRGLLPAAALCGGILLVWADALARTVLAPVELPVGVITAFIGGPFFLWLLWRRQR
ncbi:iron ABC transporter permease [Candidatus Acetothermia bacterium]|nr:MAG: iron ABC transporter permease [Candidatus Acetothermia bacterium]RLE34980.1 MAG: iron ABC transporter permease [Candidatus Acetothermia bacterium]